MAIRSLLVIAILGLTAAYARDLDARRTYSEMIPELATLPTEFDGWRSEDYPLSQEVQEVLAADVTLHRRFMRSDGRQAWLFLAYFAEQQVNSQIHSPRNCIPGSGWKIRSVKEETLPMSGGQSATCMIIGRNQAQQEVHYWFRTRGGSVSGEYALKWDLIKNSLARRPTDAVFIRFTAASEDTEAMHELMGLLDHPLDDMLTEVGLK